MSRTPAELRTWFDEEYAGRDWNGLCQAATANAARATGGLDRYYLTATAAWQASRIESFDPSKAPAGAVHYWDIPNPDGHVAVDLWGSGVGLLRGAPATLIQDFWGTSLGVASFNHISSSRPGWAYR